MSAKSSATDLVSDADREADVAIRDRLRELRPEDAVSTEEFRPTTGRSGVAWHVDPLDGTINFLFGVPHWAVSVACEDQHGPLAGVVYDPLRDELFTAARGGGARLGDVRLHVSDRDDLATALVATGFAYIARDRAQQARIATQVLPVVRDLRRFGSAALDLAYVASGRFDAYYESVSHAWDWAAGALLVREAGGVVSERRPARASHPNIVASGPKLHTALLQLLDRAVQNAEKSLDF